VALVACHPARPPIAPVALSASPPIDVDVGPGTPVIEQGDALYVLGGHVATVLRGGAITARIEATGTWATGGTIAAPDGEGRWVIAVDDSGVPWRLTMAGEREPIADRLGIAGAHVVHIAGAGPTTAIDLGDAIAYTTDGVHLVRVPAEPSYRFAVARGALARAVQGGAGHAPHIELWDLVHATRVTYPILANDVTFLDADSDHPRLVASIDDALLVADASGTLHRLAAPALVRDLAARGDRLWLEAAGHLFTLAGTAIAPTTVTTQPVFLLAASTTGDAWLGTSHGLVRYSAGSPHDDPAWQAQVAPVFQRVCAHCHLPGGDAGIDLSTPASWLADRAEITRRVLVTRTMPPAGTDITDADRAALATWLRK
jgi:mono/diheme cytochrome c family protein